MPVLAVKRRLDEIRGIEGCIGSPEAVSAA
jgi:hypothetical protein